VRFYEILFQAEAESFSKQNFFIPKKNIF
jgi:hypothetical protein